MLRRVEHPSQVELAAQDQCPGPLQKLEQARMSLLEKARARPDQVRKVLDTARTLGWKAAIEKVRNRLESPTPLGYSAAGVVLAVDEQSRYIAFVWRRLPGGKIVRRK